MLKDSDRLDALGLTKGGKLFFRDLGPQVGWTTVSNSCFKQFLCVNKNKNFFIGFVKL